MIASRRRPLWPSAPPSPTNSSSRQPMPSPRISRPFGQDVDRCRVLGEVERVEHRREQHARAQRDALRARRDRGEDRAATACSRRPRSGARSSRPTRARPARPRPPGRRSRGRSRRRALVVRVVLGGEEAVAEVHLRDQGPSGVSPAAGCRRRRGSARRRVASGSRSGPSLPPSGPHGPPGRALHPTSAASSDRAR